jgi:hypothetical protein
VREHDEVIGPLREQQRAVDEIGVLADQGERLVTLVVPVTLDAAVDVRAVESAELGDLGQGLAQSRRHEHGLRDRGRLLPTELARDLEPTVDRNHVRRQRLPVLRPVVAQELVASELAQLERRDAVPREVTMREQRGRVARPVAVDQQDASSGADEVERGTQPRGPSPDDRDVVALGHERSARAASRARVDSRPRISIDSNNGGLTRRPDSATRSGP